MTSIGELWILVK